eukprot:TRINITY_DN6669_c0_g1_i1.p1 TRINITY_DN6669_c0_g1~~TRINITY_DN6669_c0_g1_i1.p1  ORF type:complete len:276 (-),score=69.28 TRINITY_DN6669_c0_g1_i1:83-910(-)
MEQAKTLSVYESDLTRLQEGTGRLISFLKETISQHNLFDLLDLSVKLPPTLTVPAVPPVKSFVITFSTKEDLLGSTLTSVGQNPSSQSTLQQPSQPPAPTATQPPAPTTTQLPAPTMQAKKTLKDATFSKVNALTVKSPCSGIPMACGKLYWTVQMGREGGNYDVVGVVCDGWDGTKHQIGHTTNSWGWYTHSGASKIMCAGTQMQAPPLTGRRVAGLLLDTDAATLTFFQADTKEPVAPPLQNVRPAAGSTMLFPAIALCDHNSSATVNFDVDL